LWVLRRGDGRTAARNNQASHTPENANPTLTTASPVAAVLTVNPLKPKFALGGVAAERTQCTSPRGRFEHGILGRDAIKEK